MMNPTKRMLRVATAGMLLAATSAALAADWPQWRGPNRDGKAQFDAPQNWPQELTSKWKATVGEGAATPALAGDKVYAFGRMGDEEVVTALDAATGKQVWQDKYPAVNVSGPAGSHRGPRSSPAVADGKVVTLGVGGILSCYDSQSGKMLWRKESAREFTPAWPSFYTAMSPLITDGLCIAHLGGGQQGALIAYDLNSGEPKWKWDGEGPSYASPVVMTIGGVKQVVTVADRSIIGLGIEEGKVLWQMAAAAPGPGGWGGRGPGGPGGPGGGRGRGPDGQGGGGGAGAAQGTAQQGGQRGPGGPGGAGGPGARRGGGGGGGGMSYSIGTPIPLGDDTIAITNRGGTRALKIEKTGDTFAAKEIWTNPDAGTAFNTPVAKDGKLYGLSGADALFCVDAKTGKTLWTQSLQAGGAAPAGQGGPGGGRGRGGGARGGGFGSIIDAGSVLMALTPAGELVVFKPSETGFAQVARLKVAGGGTYAHPVVADKRILIKDQDAVTMYVVE